MPERILGEDWSEYERRKLKEGGDTKYVDCREIWELNYLLRLIQKVYPVYPEGEIRLAISACCTKPEVLHSRITFVECVLKRLR